MFALKLHVYRKHEEHLRSEGWEAFECFTCKRVFFSEANLKVHLDRDHAPEPRFLMWKGLPEPREEEEEEAAAAEEEEAAAAAEEEAEAEEEEDEEEDEEGAAMVARQVKGKRRRIGAEEEGGLNSLGLRGPREAWVPIPTASSHPGFMFGDGLWQKPKPTKRKHGCFPCGITCEDGMACQRSFASRTTLAVHTKREHLKDLPILQPTAVTGVIVRRPWDMAGPPPTDLASGPLFLCTLCDFVVGGDPDFVSEAKAHHAQLAHLGTPMQSMWSTMDSRVWWCPSPMCGAYFTRHTHHAQACGAKHVSTRDTTRVEGVLPAPALIVTLFKCEGRACLRLDKTKDASIDHQLRSTKVHTEPG